MATNTIKTTKIQENEKTAEKKRLKKNERRDECWKKE